MANETKPKYQDAIASVQKAVDQAARVSKIAQEMKDAGINFKTYKHPLTKPLSYEGTTFEVLELDWTILTGQDSLAIETELAKKQKTLVNALWSEDYLAGMAVRRRGCPEPPAGMPGAGAEQPHRCFQVAGLPPVGAGEVDRGE